jgi:hypothetical protein
VPPPAPPLPPAPANVHASWTVTHCPWADPQSLAAQSYTFCTYPGQHAPSAQSTFPFLGTISSSVVLSEQESPNTWFGVWLQDPWGYLHMQPACVGLSIPPVFFISLFKGLMMIPCGSISGSSPTPDGSGTVQLATITSVPNRNLEIGFIRASS